VSYDIQTTIWETLVTVITHVVLNVAEVTTSVSGTTGNDTDGHHVVMLGISFSITCDISCPTAVLTWTQDGTDISNSSSGNVTVDGFSVNYTTNSDGYVSQSVLTKAMADPTDTATYQCSTSIQNMTASADEAIFVYGKYY